VSTPSIAERVAAGDVDLEAIRARAEAATPGPWQWFGNTDVRNIYLATKRWGRQFVMQFDRWGMNGAQPVFCAGRTWKPDPQSMRDFDYDFDLSIGMTKAQELPVYEVAPNATSRKDPAVYRADLSGIRHPDAVFIAAARQDVADLLALVDELRAELDERDAEEIDRAFAEDDLAAGEAP
jgi:hypothetical protein